MVDVKSLLLELWSWIVEHGLTLAALAVVGVLIPRLGRLTVRIVTDRMSRSGEQRKSYLALVGALVYLLEIIAYFCLVYIALTELGVSTVGAAVPATVVSAAIGFGAQKVIADFLAGFFIISEHQYGVGDVVSFDGTSERINGTVVRLTLRSTQIRSWNGELITVPNSQAGIAINSSQRWSRAVVDLELPMTGEDTMSSLSETVTVVTQHAIDAADVREEILGELSVLPAMNITPPTAAGLPWTVGIQVGVDVNPATQWKVQRIIRAALINEFWERFQAPGGRNTLFPGPPTQPFAPVTPPDVTSRSDAITPASSSTASGASGGREAGEPPAAGTESAEEDVADDRADPATDDDPATGQAPFEAVADDVAANGIWRNLDPDSWITRILSLGGRIRPSSGVLVLVIVVLAVVGLLSANPSGGRSGVLSPDRLQPAPASPSVVVPTPLQTSPPETDQSGQGQSDVTVTPSEDAPNGTGGATEDRDTAGTGNGDQQGGSSRTGEPTPDTGQQSGGTSGNGGTGGNSDSTGGTTDNGATRNGIQNGTAAVPTGR